MIVSGVRILEYLNFMNDNNALPHTADPERPPYSLDPLQLEGGV